MACGVVTKGGGCCNKRRTAVTVKPWIWKAIDKKPEKPIIDDKPDETLLGPFKKEPDDDYCFTQLGNRQKPFTLKVSPLARAFMDELKEGRCPPADATVDSILESRKAPLDVPETDALPVPPPKEVVPEDRAKVAIPSQIVGSVPAASYDFCDLTDNMLTVKDDRIRAFMITTSKATIKAGPGVTVKSKADKICLKSPATGAVLRLAPANGENIICTSTLGASKIGPAFCLPIVWDPKDVNAIISAINARTNCKYKLDGKSDTYNRYKSASAEMVNSWFTNENILTANALFNYDDSCPSKWTLSKMYQTIKSLNEKYGIGLTKLQLKPETIFNMTKFPRIIQNEGPERCVMNLRVVFIIEHVIFKIIAPHMGIKNKDKKVALDCLCERFMRKMHPDLPVKYCILGIDQSAFDFSCHYQPAKTVVKDGVSKLYPEAGLLLTEVNIMKKIISVISPTEAAEWLVVMMRERTSVSSTGSFKIGSRAVAEGELKMKTRNNRKSGDRGTSVLNWIVEFLSTISTIFLRPDYIVSGIAARSNKDVPSHMVDSNKLYDTVFCDAETKLVIRSTFQGIFEGDDGLLRLLAVLSLFLKEIEANYHSLGLNCTLECSSSDKETVIEFVGCHLLVDCDGNTMYFDGRGGGAFCALVNKAIVKSSWTMSDAKLADVAASSFHSRVLQFQGKVRWVESYFEKMRDYWVKNGGMYRRELTDQYMGIEERSDYLPDDVQRKLLLLSTGSALELSGAYVEFGETLTMDTRASDILTSMPEGFRAFVSKLVRGGAGPQYGERIKINKVETAELY
jgi:hypothetical protein